MERTEGGLTAYVEDEEAAVGALVALVGVPVQTVRAHRPTLDDVFLHYTGREIRDECTPRAPCPCSPGRTASAAEGS